MTNKKYIIIFTLIIIFFLSLIIRYYPIWHKGYQYSISAENLILARNLSLTNKYSLEDSKNIILSSGLVEKKGIPSNLGNKLTPIIYKYIFDLFGLKLDLALYISLLLFGLTNILLFLLLLKLFNFQIACLFSLIDIFMPLVIKGAGIDGFYEWAMLFFTIGLLIYLLKEKGSYSRLIFASLFFGLAALARNAFLISFIPFIIYDFWKNRSYQRIIVFILPFILLWGIYLGPDYLAGQPNRYLAQGDIGYDGHLFPDPYTYHFKKDNYLRNIENPNGELISFLAKYNYPLGLKDHLASYFYSLKFYLREIFRIVNLGGIFIVLLALIGGVYLYQRKHSWLKLFSFWFIFLFASLIFLKTSNWDHFLEIRFPIILLIALGLYYLIEFIKQLNIQAKFRYLWIIILILTIVFHLFETNRWNFHEIYNTSQMKDVLNLVEKVNQKKISKNDVIAVGLYQGAPLVLNYYTDKNFVYFSPQTIEKLLKEDKLSLIFREFGVTKIIGFEAALSQEMLQQIDLEDISLGFN
jgi:hypothetical protein